MTTHREPPDALEGVSAVKLALMAKQARAQVGAVVAAEPIAIVGIGCRFPGGADSPERYWKVLRDGIDAVRELPCDRWDIDATYDRDPAALGKMTARHAGTLDEVDAFDAGFFGILGREAERMDPQHRVFLEVAVDALDHAGLPRERLAGTKTGVFIASYYNDYTVMQLADPEAIDARTLTGTQHSVLANRLSYLLDLRGPSVSVDTACSSSLVATHLACQSLRSGDSDVALAGGVSLILSADMMIVLSKVGFMSPTGRCRTFDAAADGFVRGEGCGVVVLKRLSDAIADDDRVLAVIRGSAVNQDGRSTVISAPNGLAQEDLIRDALARAHVAPERVGFVEAHGTATALGDPIEVEALAATVGAPRADGSVCYLGSAKANLGHLEAAAGVAGLIKATLVLQHGEIPRQLHFDQLNHHLSLDGTALAVADEHRSWRAGSAPRVAGVSGFGVGGTNAHVVLEEAPALPPRPTETCDEGPHLLPLSARSEDALRELAAAWVGFFDVTSSGVGQLCASAASHRSHDGHRLAVVGRTLAELGHHLQGYLDRDPGPSVAAGRPPVGGTARVGFVFSGQGPQWAQMGRELSEREPVFREAMAEIDALFGPIGGTTLLAALAEPAETSPLQETEIAQPAIFAVQVALATLWASWGIEPDAVVGHSIGELAALHVAGVLTLGDAVRIVRTRGRLMQHATGHGRMAAAGLTAPEALDLVAEVGADLALAAVNGPRSVVLAGTPEAVQRAEDLLDARGVAHRQLPVSYAFHSAQMAPFQAELAARVDRLDTRPARLAVYSTVTGARIDHTAVDAVYLGRNVRDTIRFADAIGAMVDAGLDAIVEIAPHPVLASSIAECLVPLARDVPVLASMRRGRPERDTMLQACAGIYAAGRTPAWEAVTGPAGPPVDLPRYPWQRQRYWLRDAPDRPDHRTRRSRAATPASWLSDHVVAGHVLMPATALLEMMRQAATPEGEEQGRVLTDVVVHEPLILDDDRTVCWRTVVVPDDEGADVAVWTVPAGDGASRCIASGHAEPDLADRSAVDAGETAGEWRDEEWRDDGERRYDAFADLGVRFGPAFRTLRSWRSRDGAAEGWLEPTVPDDAGAAGAIHPTVLDGALQLSVLAATTVDGVVPGTVMLPVAIESYTVLAPAPGPLLAQVRLCREVEGGSLVTSVRLSAEDGTEVARLDGVRFAPVDAATLATLGGTDCYEVRWRPRPGQPAAADGGAWLVLADGEAGDALVKELTAAGGGCLQVRPGTTSQRHDASAWTVAPGDGALLADAVSDDRWRGAQLRGVVHAWGLDAEGRVGDDWLAAGSALQLVQALASTVAPDVTLYLVTRGAQPATGTVTHPAQASLWGLAAAVAAELPDLHCRAVDVDDRAGPADVAALVAELLAVGDTPSRVALRDGGRLVPRLHPRAPRRPAPPPSASERAECLVASASGTLDELAWEPIALAPPRAGEVRLRVLAAGLNFRDVLLGLGMHPDHDADLGGECAGVVEALGPEVVGLQVGDTVFGFTPGGLASHVNAPAAYLRRVPSGLSVDDAAALPVAYLTAMLGLERLAGIGPGRRVLVHAASGGVGLAAVQVAQRRGAEVLATAGSDAKRDLLRGLGVAHVFDSRSIGFANEVRTATGGHGADVVINSLTGELIDEGLRAVADGGWFLELGKLDGWTADAVAEVRPGVHYCRYDLGQEAAADAGLVGSLLDELLAAIGDRSLRPLPVKTFGFDAATEAFRWMAQARHVGKIVLRAPSPAPAGAGPATARPLVHADGTYWITGGTGAIGVRTARWLTGLGARTLVLTGRSAPGPDAQRTIDECVAAGAAVHVRSADAGDRQAMAAVHDEIATTLPPLRGVIHAAGVIDDGLLVQLTPQRWRDVVRAKADGATILNDLTRDQPLDLFVLYSSASVLLGPFGQGSYVAANAELDALAAARRSTGRPGLSVAWGQWSEAGMAVRAAGPDPDRGWSARGLGWIEAADGFAHLEQLLRDDATHALVAPIDWDRFLSSLPQGVDRSFFRAVAPHKRATAPAPARSRGPATVVAEWRAAPAGDRRRLVVAHLAARAQHVIGTDCDLIADERVPLKDVGLDSLMSVELRNDLTRTLGTPLPATLLFDHPTLDALASYVLGVLDLRTAAASARPDPMDRSRTDELAELSELSEEDAEALLLAELGSREGSR